MWKLVEPQWGIDLLKLLFAWMQANDFWSYRIPIFADLFVFTYPVYLLGLYVYGMVERKRDKVQDTKARQGVGSKGIYHKIAAVYIFAGTVMSVIVNIGIQFFVEKVRPNVVLGLVDLKRETVLHAFLPSASFPSDHAAVSMAIAMMSLFRGLRNKDKTFLRFGGILMIFSLITSFARIASGVHRPTDVIAGSIIGICVPLLMMRRPVYRFGVKIAERIGKLV